MLGCRSLEQSFSSPLPLQAATLFALLAMPSDERVEPLGSVLTSLLSQSRIRSVRGCRARYPRSLLKGVWDAFQYVRRLSNGDTVVFHSATITGDYCTLGGIENAKDLCGLVQQVPYIFDRGLDVRVSEIVWCCDAGPSLEARR
jgi:hypothetical protein